MGGRAVAAATKRHSNKKKFILFSFVLYFTFPPRAFLTSEKMKKVNYTTDPGFYIIFIIKLNYFTYKFLQIPLNFKKKPAFDFLLTFQKRKKWGKRLKTKKKKKKKIKGEKKKRKKKKKKS